jgi:hypothetical protein
VGRIDTGNLGPGQLYAAYFKANNGRVSSCTTTAGVITCPVVGGAVLGENTSSQKWKSATRIRCRRTLLYAGYVMIDNKANAGYNFAVGSVTGLCSGNQRGAISSNLGCGDAAKP